MSTEYQSGKGRGGRGGASRGRSGGRGRGRGGRGGGGNNNNNNNNNDGGRPQNNKLNKQDRKAFRRQKQLDTMAKKAQAEDDYFRECQREAQKQSKDGKRKGSTAKKDDTNKEREAELFAQQIVKGINFDKYNDIKVEVKVGKNANANVKTMDDFSNLQHLDVQLMKNIRLMKYTHPTPIQKNAIPLAMDGEDLMCCAQTGSGKTCAFLLPVVAATVRQQQQKQNEKNVSNDNNNNTMEPAKPVCVVLAPTRELASQIELEAQKLTHAIPSVQPVCVYGGANARPQLKELAVASGSHNDLVVVATPGRLTDFVDRNLISLCDVRFLVLDEADRMVRLTLDKQTWYSSTSIL